MSAFSYEAAKKHVIRTAEPGQEPRTPVDAAAVATKPTGMSGREDPELGDGQVDRAS